MRPLPIAGALEIERSFRGDQIFAVLSRRMHEQRVPANNAAESSAAELRDERLAASCAAASRRIDVGRALLSDTSIASTIGGFAKAE